MFGANVFVENIMSGMEQPELAEATSGGGVGGGAGKRVQGPVVGTLAAWRVTPAVGRLAAWVRGTRSCTPGPGETPHRPWDAPACSVLLDSKLESSLQASLCC